MAGSELRSARSSPDLRDFRRSLSFVGWVWWLGFLRMKPATQPAGVDSDGLRPSPTRCKCQPGRDRSIPIGLVSFDGSSICMDTPT